MQILQYIKKKTTLPFPLAHNFSTKDHNKNWLINDAERKIMHELTEIRLALFNVRKKMGVKDRRFPETIYYMIERRNPYTREKLSPIYGNIKWRQRLRGY